MSVSDNQLRQTAGTVLDVKRFAIHDGPGVRTTVFLKGCPLRCVWCHNPHSIRMRREVSFNLDRCTLCGQCVTLCEHGCHQVSADGHAFNREACVVCGSCFDACVQDALQFIGQTRTVGDVMDEVLKDRKYYKTSDGGVTISGGEPMAQFQFTKAFLTLAKQEQLHTVLDTCGWAEWERYAEILPLVDLVHFDVKETDSARHEQYTGRPNEKILDNLRRMDAMGVQTIFRCPIVPGLNDREEHLRKIGELASSCQALQAVHILPFHPFGDSHAQKIGVTNELASLPAATDEQAEAWIAHTSAHSSVPVSRG